MRGSPGSWKAWLLVSLALVLNALDGYDILAISFAAPGIASEWRVPPASLGVVLSMELLGMALGSIMLGRAADRFGRRPVVLSCLTSMAAGMCGSVASHGLPSLCVSRLLTGIGIGGMLASLNAIVSEASPQRSKAFAIAMMNSGFSVGGLAGGAVTASLLIDYGWRSAFAVGAAGSFVMLPVAWKLLPESPAFLRARRGVPDTVGSPRNVQLDESDAPAPGQPSAGALIEENRPIVWIILVLTAAYLLNAFSFYFVLKWVPKLVVNLGYSPTEAGHLLVMANAGGFAGALGFGFLSLKWPTRTILMCSLPATSVLIAAFGVPHGWSVLTMIAALIGCMGNASVAGFYALCAESFPTPFRGAGTGLVIGFGRGGAVIGPVTAGLLVGFGFSFEKVFLAMAVGSLLSAIALLSLPYAMRRSR